jgi:hypothetical protein
MLTSAALASTVLTALLAAIPVMVRPSSDVEDCPSSLQVQSALRRVLGDTEPSDGWVLSYGRDPAASGTSRDADVLMELFDPGGESVLVRRISAGECAVVANVMAAVVERSLRTLGWTQNAPLPEITRTEATPSSPAPAKKRLPRLVLGMGPSLGTPPQAGTNLLLEARVRVAGPVFLQLNGGIFAGSDSQTVGAGVGKASVSSRSFTAAPLLALARGPVELAGGPALMLSFDHASSQGISVTGSGNRRLVAVGVGITAAMRLSARWRVSLGLEGFRVAAGGHYIVAIDGKKVEVLAPSPWQGFACLKMEFVAWP